MFLETKTIITLNIFFTIRSINCIHLTTILFRRIKMPQYARELQISMLETESIIMTTFNLAFYLLEMKIICPSNVSYVRKCLQLEALNLVI